MTERQTQFYALRDEALTWLVSYLQKKSLKIAAYIGPGIRKGERITKVPVSASCLDCLSRYAAIVGYSEDVPEFSEGLFKSCQKYLELSIGGDQESPYESILFSRDCSERSDFHGVHAAFRKRLFRGAWIGKKNGVREYYRSLPYSEGIREFVDKGGVVSPFQGAASILMFDAPPEDPRGRVIEDFKDGAWVRRV
jgi:hypothetical protein